MRPRIEFLQLKHRGEMISNRVGESPMRIEAQKPVLEVRIQPGARASRREAKKHDYVGENTAMTV